MKTITLTTLAIALAASSASADGLYVSGKVSSLTFGHEIERNTEAALGAPDNSAVTRTEETDISGGIALGYEQTIGDGTLYWGVEGYYDAHNGESRNINNVLVTEVALDATYGARVILGANVSDKVRLYTHAGVAQVEFDVTNSYTFAPPVTEESFDETGFTFGVGASVAINDQVALFTEYTQLTGVDFDGIGEVAGGTGRVNDNTLDLSSLAIGVKYSF